MGPGADEQKEHNILQTAPKLWVSNETHFGPQIYHGEFKIGYKIGYDNAKSLSKLTGTQWAIGKYRQLILCLLQSKGIFSERDQLEISCYEC